MRFVDLSYGMAFLLALGGAMSASCGSGSTRRATPYTGGAGPGRGGSAGDEPGGTSGATSTGGSTGAGGTGTVPPGGGVGDDCSRSAPCRRGLDCVNDVCEAAGTLDPGSPCTIQPECQAGLNCTNGTCGPAGDGRAGDSCLTDSDCREGLRCLVTG